MHQHDQQTSRRSFLKTTAAAAAAVAATGLPSSARAAGKSPIVDTHMHVWAADLKKYPFARKMKPPKIPATVELLNEEMDQFGIDYCVLVQVIYHGWDNRYVAECIKRFPKRFRGHGLIDPEDPQVAQKLEYWMREHNFAGMRFSPIYYQGKDDWLTSKAHNQLWEKAAELGAVFNMFIASGQLPKLETMIARHPTVPVVIDHLANIKLSEPDPQTEFQKLLRLAKYPNVYCKVSELSARSLTRKHPYNDMWPYVRRMYDAFGADHLMWGTGFPGATRAQDRRPPLEEELALIQEDIPFFSDEDRQKILGRTAAKLWKFGEQS